MLRSEREKFADELERAVRDLKVALYREEEWAKELLELWWANVPEDFRKRYTDRSTEDMDDG